MNLFVETYFNENSIHFGSTSLTIANALRNTEGWKVAFYKHDNYIEICNAITDTEIKLLVFTHNMFAIKNAQHRRAIRKSLMRSRAVRLFFIEDVIGERWWEPMKLFNGFIGSVLYPSDTYRSIIKKYWSIPHHKGMMHFVPHGVSYHVPFNALFDKQKIVFPSRNFSSATYPYRFEWKRFIDSYSELSSRCDYLDKSSGVTGEKYIQAIGRYKACLVVVTITGYLIRKIYETIMSGSLLLLAFPPNTEGHVAREVWNNIGFTNNVHYLEATFENFDTLSKQIIESDMYNHIPENAYKEAIENHIVYVDRLRRFIEITDTYLKK